MAEETIVRESLFFQEGSSDKEYNVELVPLGGGFYDVLATWGRRGSATQSAKKNKAPVLYGAALTCLRNMVGEKLAKGYRRGGLSVARTVGQTAPADRIAPMLLYAIDRKQLDNLTADDKWLFQPKWDGERVHLHKKGENVFGVSRTGKPIAITTETVEAARGFDRDFVADGEYVQGHFICFDMLQDGESSLIKEPCESRIRYGASLFQSRREGILMSPTAYTTSEKLSLLNTMYAEGGEGIVAKLKASSYLSGRSTSAGPGLKHKFWNTATFIVASQNEQRSVNLCLFGENRLRGSVTIPVNKEIPNVGDRVEIRYLYIHDVGGNLIQPVFLGVRNDIEHEECTGGQLQIKGEER